QPTPPDRRRRNNHAVGRRNVRGCGECLAGWDRPVPERHAVGVTARRRAVPPRTDPTALGASRSRVRVHVIGAGPVGLLLTALLQTMEGFSVRLYEKRPKYTRTRMVKLSSFLVAESVESYCADYIDGENVEAVFDVAELEESL